MILDEICAGQIGTHGIGCAGAGGFTPRLAMQGCAEAGQTLTLKIDRAVGGSLGLMITGLLPANIPISGSGCSLLVAPLLPFSIVVPFGGSGPGNGSLTAPIAIPPTTIAGTIDLQVFAADPSMPAGHSVTNGLTVHVE
jgi:hypothetical protein